MRVSKWFLFRMVLIVLALTAGVCGVTISEPFPWSLWMIVAISSVCLAFAFSVVVCVVQKRISGQDIAFCDWHCNPIFNAGAKLWLGGFISIGLGIGLLLRGMFKDGANTQLGLLLLSFGVALLAGTVLSVWKCRRTSLTCKIGKQDKVLRAMGLAIALSSLLPLAIGVYVGGKTLRFVASSTQGVGTVVGWSTSLHGTETLYRPVISFVDAAEQRREFEGGNPSSNKSYNVGDSVSILYTKANHNSVKINSFSSLWLFPTMLWLMGAVSGSVGIYMCFHHSGR